MSDFLNQLRKYKVNRGLMANLRCILVENKRHRAWPALHRLGIDINNMIQSFIAGLYSLHPEETTKGNFGTTCKFIEQKRREKQSDSTKLSPTERRFQLLLSAESGKELNNRLLRMVYMAKASDIPINYEKMEKDIKYWNDRTKIEWASAFWSLDITHEMGGLE